MAIGQLENELTLGRYMKFKPALKIEVPNENLGPQQVRLIKSVNALMAIIAQTDEESEFFDGSAELLRVCAALIKTSHFPNTDKSTDHGIPYAEQVLEYSLEALQDHMSEESIITYDN